LTKSKSQSIGIYVLIISVIFQGFSGILGGIGLVIDPRGELLHIPIEWLENSPFKDYLIPGIILLIILGVFPLIVVYGLWKNLPWAWFSALVLGIALLIWIGVEILIIGYQNEPPLQLIYGVVGLSILISTLLPSVQRLLKHNKIL
jgi:hypothetical protein